MGQTAVEGRSCELILSEIALSPPEFSVHRDFWRSWLGWFRARKGKAKEAASEKASSALLADGRSVCEKY